MIGALGDIHGAFAAARAVIARHPEVPFWLCVGDIASDSGAYEALGAPVYWVHGNNDNFDAVAAGDLPPGLHHVANGTAIDVPLGRGDVGRSGAGGRVEAGVLRVAGVGGTFAPTWYETPAAELPQRKKGSATDDKRRHFVRGEVEAAARLRDVDVLLTHEAAKPFRVFPGGRGPDAGKAQINEILRAMRPRLHLFGHHHRRSEQVVEGVRSIGLDLVSRSYALLALPGLVPEFHDTP